MMNEEQKQLAEDTIKYYIRCFKNRYTITFNLRVLKNP